MGKNSRIDKNSNLLFFFLAHIKKAASIYASDLAIQQ
jgi:hypothetical protein